MRGLPFGRPRPILTALGTVKCALGRVEPEPAHRFGRSRIVSAPPAARTANGPFKARTPARPDGAKLGSGRKDLRPLPLCGSLADPDALRKIRLARVRH